MGVMGLTGQFQVEDGNEVGTPFHSINIFADGREFWGAVGAAFGVDGEVIAFSLGEKLNPDTFVVHIEKAFADIQGAYPMINQQFVANEAQEFAYINREEDTGSEGLRKAKLSYRPIFLVNKGIVSEIL